MIKPREPVSTVTFIDEYCQTYRNPFSDVRNFEALKYLHLGMISEIPRKSLPAIARVVRLKDGQELHHFLRDTPSIEKHSELSGNGEEKSVSDRHACRQ